MKGRFLETYGVLIAFLILFIVGAVRQPHVFLQPENLRNLVSQNASTGILAVGMTLVIIGGGIDLSVGSMLALAAAFMVLTLNKSMAVGRPEGLSVSIGIGICLLSGILLGLFNGLVITLGRVAPFIATLAGLVAFRSIALAVAEGGEIRSSSANTFPALGGEGIPVPFVHIADGAMVITWSMLALVAVSLAAGFLLNSTRYGRHLVAVGANERAAVYSAIPVARVKTVSYVIMGLCVAFAAVGESARLNSVSSSQLGLYMELDAIAAVVIGGTSLSGGRGRIWGTVVGVLILGVITNMLLLEGVSVYWQGCVKGAIILVAVLIQRGQKEY